MARKTERTHRQGDESRKRILEATLEIAAERGYDGTSVALVTERTGLPASSIYWHFGNKDGLIAAVLEHSYRAWREHAPDWDSAAAPERRGETLQALLRQVDQAFIGKPEFWRLGLMLALGKFAKEPAARARFLQVRGESLERVAGWWARVLPAEVLDDAPAIPRILAQLNVATTDGFFLAARAHGDWDFTRLLHMFAVGLDAAADLLVDRVRARAALPPGIAGDPGRSAADSPAATASSGPEGDNSRLRILSAAAEIAAERGYEGTSIARVCKRSGLPVSSLYWYFKDKDELFASVLEHSFEQWSAGQATWEPVVEPAGRAAGLRATLTRSLSSLAAAPDFMRIGHMLTLEQRETEPTARVLFLDIRRRVLESMAEWFSANLGEGPSARDPELPLTLAMLLMAISDGLFIAEQVGDSWDLETFVHVIVDMIEAIITDAAPALAAG
ncbi:TetR/AcrR family transcriptional regulator [Streptomyces sp. NPDC002896]|uniref:TetR/AcrR family transcriptional regulator n=1 Tax=Streptomyces sp. NPDC002896 TaxID=3154438 RepID=UPI00331C1593